MFTPQRILQIRQSAVELFTHTQMQTLTLEHGYSLRMPNPDVAEFVLSTLSDGGLMFLATWDNLTQVWARIREEDEFGVAEWLLQTSTSFIAMGFESQEEYRAWLDHLASAYGSHIGVFDAGSNGSHGLDPKSVEKALALDDDYAERLPNKKEHLALLAANPWFAYLVTLQLSFHELFSLLYESDQRSDMAERIRNGGRTPAATE